MSRRVLVVTAVEREAIACRSFDGAIVVAGGVAVTLANNQSGGKAPENVDPGSLAAKSGETTPAKETSPPAETTPAKEVVEKTPEKKPVVIVQIATVPEGASVYDGETLLGNKQVALPVADERCRAANHTDRSNKSVFMPLGKDKRKSCGNQCHSTQHAYETEHEVDQILLFIIPSGQDQSVSPVDDPELKHSQQEHDRLQQGYQAQIAIIKH